ncbi:PREDICTED: uncharacterized protein LOC104823512 [Tarenaya hassleriana]|uniref:uncharacterized protein LOC104823512 n=1 Tax=Tarenaya hassleriana TaxID=28532 RepID=UPI00053C734B|nr:PREDICTED: uncharacterized protein LOC104823512 [Tarenaya hassleriana]
MGWVWRDESSATDGDDFIGGSAGDGQCSTSKVVRSQCKTEEVEPGRFVKKCERTEEVLRHCLGMPPEVIHSNKEYTEEEISNPSLPNRFEQEDPLKFPGLRSDIDAIERHFFSGMKSFFDAAEDMANDMFDVYRDLSSHPSTSRGAPFEDGRQRDSYENDDDNAPTRHESGHVDLSSLTREV